MDISKEGIAELASYEGLSLKPYLCSANVKTVGFGSTVSDIPDLPHWPWSKEISIADAVDLYKKGLVKYVNAVNRAVTKLEISQNKFDTLVSICYNIGIGGMSGSTFIKRVNAGASDESVCSAIKAWNKGGGRVLKGLVNRRNAECILYTQGIYKSGGYCDLIEVDSNHKPHYNKRIKIIDYL